MPLLTLADILWGVILTIWVGIVTLYISKIISKYTSVYVARKAIHMLGGGVVAVVSPFVFTSPLVPIIASYTLMTYLIVRRIKDGIMGWFQEKDNYGEIFYTFSYGTLLLIMWVIDGNYWSTKDVFIPLLPILYMSFGDGVTGIIRNYVYKRRVKGFWGSVGMAIVCIPLGYYLFGLYGAISGIIATVVEALPLVDDNLSIPFISFLFLYSVIKLF
ncbi:phosphatidate cytidylyltransferase [Sulfurisphaera ohwakuensis]|uniref:Dolichol kinase n=1 Tax=Sulfurisphaera ohwakuensis TaxID=69656 RepID=A0A650CJD2_SULOH|nr:phosphatidate cytidylyltransferase [Sulfurisphaera ohwakuensis]MBB5253873.1 dolichol kinase [Sulfurisphaera ohwakuensis]QGR17940.1 phosphatidate cytidylyltransferase [Sulfurisphaera ohwakuensis]